MTGIVRKSTAAAAIGLITVGALSTGCGGGARSSLPSVSATSPSAVGPLPMTSVSPMKIPEPYAPRIDPSAFSATITNPYLPLAPGTRTIYVAQTPDGVQRTTTEVTRDTKKVMGVDTVVVHDTVTLDGRPAEDTFDWYAQDRDGNVWYFGEATQEFANGAPDSKGSFEAGVGGALPGIAMPGHPHVGDQYRQEYAKGIAEDTGEVLSLTGTESTPLTGAAKDLLVTKDADLLDPTGGVEDKYYAPGVGLILTVSVGGGAERDQATATEKF